MFSGNYFPIFLGNDSKRDTPVPIPNTEVKSLNADDSESENRKLPRIFFCAKKTQFLWKKSFYNKYKKIIDIFRQN